MPYKGNSIIIELKFVEAVSRVSLVSEVIFLQLQERDTYGTRLNLNVKVFKSMTSFMVEEEEHTSGHVVMEK